MTEAKTIKVKPWGEDQGDHVLINEADFNPEVHTPFEEQPPEQTPEKPPEQPPAPARKRAANA